MRPEELSGGGGMRPVFTEDGVVLPLSRYPPLSPPRLHALQLRVCPCRDCSRGVLTSRSLSLSLSLPLSLALSLSHTLSHWQVHFDGVDDVLVASHARPASPNVNPYPLNPEP